MPVETVEFSTRDADLAMQTLTEVYAPDRPFRLSGTRKRLEFSLRATQVGDLHGGRFRSNMPTRALAAPFEDFMAATVLDGAIGWISGGEDLALGRGDVVRYPTTAGSDTAYDGYEVALVRIPIAAVELVAQARTGLPAGQLRFDGMVPVSPAAARQWRQLDRFVHQSLSEPELLAATPLLNPQLIEMVAAMALAVFPNTTMTTTYSPGPSWVPPAAVRRAAAFIEAHPDQPVTLADIAAVAGVTGRALQYAFRRHYQLTPTGYLRQVRLERAHHDLRTADPASAVTVAAVARKWGWASPTQFSAVYRRQFGHPPSRTLRT
jgi:AraC-like DNA-binding protein